VLVLLLSPSYCHPRPLHSFPTRRSSDLALLFGRPPIFIRDQPEYAGRFYPVYRFINSSHLSWALRTRSVTSRTAPWPPARSVTRSEEHTSELQSLRHLVCRLLLEKKKNN